MSTILRTHSQLADFSGISRTQKNDLGHVARGKSAERRFEIEGILVLYISNSQETVYLSSIPKNHVPHLPRWNSPSKFILSLEIAKLLKMRLVL